MRRALTYGTYELLHYGHIRLLKRAKELGDYETRKKMLEAIRYVDLVIPEDDWEQKIDDVKKYCVDVTVMGGDWEGNEKFEVLRDYCEVVYLPRTQGISTTKIKEEFYGIYRLWYCSPDFYRNIFCQRCFKREKYLSFI